MPSSPWSSSRDVSAEASRLIIERAHEELVAGNVDDRRLAQVRPLVRASWERAWRGRVGAEGLPPVDFDADALERYRAAHPLAATMDLIRRLLLPGAPEDSGVVVAVGDHAGRLLWVEGDVSQRLLSGEMGFIEGANWSEDAVGTSAPGTAITLGHSVQIHQAEHYNRLVQPWSCTAAPVFDPESRRILGVIDVTGGAEARRRRHGCWSTRPPAPWNPSCSSPGCGNALSRRDPPRVHRGIRLPRLGWCCRCSGETGRCSRPSPRGRSA